MRSWVCRRRMIICRSKSKLLVLEMIGEEGGADDGSLEGAVMEDVKFLKESPLISEGSKKFISGWVYEVETGLLKRIV